VRGARAITVKGKGEVEAWYLVRRRDERPAAEVAPLASWTRPGERSPSVAAVEAPTETYVEELLAGTECRKNSS